MTATLRRTSLLMLPLMVIVLLAASRAWTRPIYAMQDRGWRGEGTPTPLPTARQQFLPVVMADGKPTNTPERTQPTKTLTPTDTPTFIPTATELPTSTPTPINAPPVVDAGAPQVITWPASAMLTGTVSDDGLPSGQLTVAWSKAEGPGAVTFDPVDQPQTIAIFSQPGTYVLALTADDGAATRTALVEVIIKGIPPAPATDVQVSAVSSSTLLITWTDNATDEDGYIVDEGDTEFTVPADSTAFRHEHLPPADYHCYQVFAFNAYGRSDPTGWHCADTLPVAQDLADPTSNPAGLAITRN